MSDVAILIPMLGRVHRVPALLESIRRSTENYRVYLIACADDRNVLADWHVTTDPDPTLPPRWFVGSEDVDLIVAQAWTSGVVGDYARKINLGVSLTDEPFLFLGAIDLRFCPGWWSACMAGRDRWPQAGVFGTQDCCNRRTERDHSTHSLVTRAYIDEYGTIDEPAKVLHEGYPHEFVDDEFVRTAQYRGRYLHVSDAHVEHLHPMCGKGITDPLYDAQHERMHHGRALFLERQHLWEGRVRP